MNKNIILMRSVEEYNNKYKHLGVKLVKYSKKQVEDFDKEYGHYKFNGSTRSLEFSNYLLKGKRWALIGDTYYEIPNCKLFFWIKNLNRGVQAALCTLVGGAIVTSVTVPMVLAAKQSGGGGDKPTPEPEPTPVPIPDYLEMVSIEGEEDCCAIKAKGDVFPESLTIPSHIIKDGKTYTVIAVSDLGFQGKSVNEVILPSTINEVGYGAFGMGCSLKKIKLNNGLDKIGSCCFYGDTITSINIPSTLFVDASDPFGGCTIENAIIDRRNLITGNEGCGSLMTKAKKIFIKPSYESIVSTYIKNNFTKIGPSSEYSNYIEYDRNP